MTRATSYRPDARDSVAVPIAVPGPLRSLAGGAGEVVVEGGTVGEALEALLREHPGLRRHLRTDDGALREHINVFLDEEDIRTLGGESTPLTPGRALTIVPSIAGG